MNTPLDVSVIVPVYNTLPYLTDCLASLVGQSIGPDRMEIIAVDDGSTDGSRKELERFAQQHPVSFTVLRQANSGGPARPCNRGLDVAVGRYVYFLGADDYLWEKALERLVAEADEYRSDVVAGKMVGVNGRYVHQAFYAKTDHDVRLYASDLPWSMSNAKLFRRELIEQHRLRFPEDLPVNSDQSFTLEACLRARRISVLADDSYYFAVFRPDGGNITYRTRPDVNLACATSIMHRAASLIEKGPNRDAILRRHFAWELVKVLTVNFLELDTATQQRLCRGVAELVDAYFTDDIRDALTVRRRLLLSLARAGELDILREVVREQAELIAPPLFLEGDRAYVLHSGFRDNGSKGGERAYQIVAESVSRRLSDSLKVTSLRWTGRRNGRELEATFRVGMTGPAATDPVRVTVRLVPSGDPAELRSSSSAVELGAAPTVELSEDSRATIVHARIPLGQLLARRAGKWTVALCVEVAGRPYVLPLPADELLPRSIRWHRGHAFRLFSRATQSGRLQVIVEPNPWRASARHQTRSLLAHLGRG